jgi:hypothetical protein
MDQVSIAWFFVLRLREMLLAFVCYVNSLRD